MQKHYRLDALCGFSYSYVNPLASLSIEGSTSSTDIRSDKDLLFSITKSLDYSCPLLNCQLPAQHGYLVPVTNHLQREPFRISTSLKEQMQKTSEIRPLLRAPAGTLSNAYNSHPYTLGKENILEECLSGSLFTGHAWGNEIRGQHLH